MAFKISVRSRFQRRLSLVTFAMAMALTSIATAQSLVRNQAAGRLGIERTWFAQVQVNAAQHKVVHWLLDRDQLFALTSAGAVQAFDAETGQTLWTTELGVGHSPAAGVAVNSKYIALLGAGRIYVMDRTDGHHLWSRQIGGASVAAPALSETHAYVVLLSGRVEGYRLDSPSEAVWQYQSDGRIFQNPTTTGQVVSWPTDSGKLYVGQAETPRVLFRVETNDEIVTAPAEQEPYLYVASLDGYLYCFHELTGSEQWRYATGFAITSRPAIVGDIAYVASEGPTLHAVSASTGQALWQVSGAAQFVALGKQHTYGMDRYGTLVVIDNATGGVAGRLSTGAGSMALVNDQSDRIFLINDNGLVQCLKEIGADQPTWHRESSADSPATDESAAEQGTDPTETTAPDESTDDTEASPFELDEDDAGPEADEVDEPSPFEF
ncbi:MAG: PQQ-binding-like beta-propeller repeat protein [Planctomycetota bacterium]